MPVIPNSSGGGQLASIEIIVTDEYQIEERGIGKFSE